jgi:hypothetical protein
MKRVPALVALVCVMRGSLALAQVPAASKLELEWHAPSGCLDRETARAAIDRALSLSAVVRVAPAVVHVTIGAADSERWDAEIWMYDAHGSGERSVVGTSCLEVAQATVLIVALALASTPELEPATPRAGAASSQQSDRNRNRLRFAASVRVAGDTGSLPKADLGFGLTLGMEAGRARAEADLGLWLPRTASDGLAADSGGRLFLYGATLRGCYDLLRASAGAFRLGPCASAELGATLGRGLGLAVRRTRSVFWGASLLGLSARYFGAAPLWFGLLAELGLPWHRASWSVEDVGTVFQPSVLVGRMSLGVGWLFP